MGEVLERPLHAAAGAGELAALGDDDVEERLRLRAGGSSSSAYRALRRSGPAATCVTRRSVLWTARSAAVASQRLEPAVGGGREVGEPLKEVAVHGLASIGLASQRPVRFWTCSQM